MAIHYIPGRCLVGQIINPKLQTRLLVEVTWSDGTKQRAKVLVDSGCETTFLVRTDFAPQKVAYKSQRPLSFVNALIKQ